MNICESFLVYQTVTDNLPRNGRIKIPSCLADGSRLILIYKTKLKKNMA
jgi:hypothetical protein